MGKTNKLREKGAAMKKGIVITYTVTVLLLSLIGFIFVLNTQNEAGERIISIEKEIQRASRTQENIETNILEIIKNSGEINFDSNNTKAKFVETIPNKKRKENFSIALGNYKEFALKNKENFDININTSLLGTATLTIKPLDINYTHSTESSKKGKFNQININPKNNDFNGYVVWLYLKDQSYTQTTTSIKTSASNKICLELKVFGTGKNKEYENTWCNVKANDTSTITVKTSAKADKDIQVKITPTAKLAILNNNTDEKVEAHSWVDFGNDSNNSPIISLPGNVVSIKSKDHNVTAITE